MGREEQQEEREVLDSIFPDEITDLSDSKYRVSIKLDVAEEGDGDDESPTILLQVTYPEAYPDEAPELELSTPPNCPKYDLFDLTEDKPRLLESLQPVVEENIGMAMIFTLISTIKDSAELIISERKQAVLAVNEANRAAVEEEENRKFHGTAVTRESFLKWRDDFQRELEETEKRKEAEREIEDKKRRVKVEERKLTGRELWEKGLVGKIDEDEDGDEIHEDMDQLKV
ncbi:MAG: hypothetical protein M1825_004249 [Sarcosagium campestre]|nr:MAG: hypothetical protein M1825_004249 [Sarcosagium campestre]